MYPSNRPHSTRGLIVALAMVVIEALSGVGYSIRPAVGEVAWDRATSGMMATLWDPSKVCPEVPPLLMLQIDPERFRFSVHQFRDAGFTAPPTIDEWQRRTDAYVLFNAGLFREDYSYLGILLKDGRMLGSKPHPSWQGLFVSEPKEPGQRKARLFDLAFDRLPGEARQFPYRDAAQSLMLLDRTGKPRVRPTGKRAYQTIVAEDGDGKILVMKSSAPASLYELAECLRDAQPTIRQAMVMDGGSSSDVIASPELLSLLSQGRAQPGWHALLEGHANYHIGLPAVIAVAPRSANRQTGPATFREMAPAR
jgi:uncharacterized protein YigE (DUF2233 family)